MKDLQNNNNLSSETQNVIALEFLTTLLETSSVYPWNPMEKDVETYFEQLEQQINLTQTIPLEELETSVSELFNQMKDSFN